MDSNSKEKGLIYLRSQKFTMNKRASQINIGDTLECLDDIRKNSIKLVITSPPYNIGKEYEKRKQLSEYLKNQKQVITKCVEKLRDDGSICWQVGNFVENGSIIPLDMVLYPIFTDLGLKLRNRVIWHFGHGLHCSKRLSGRYETIIWFTKTDDYTFNLDPIRVPSKYPNKKYFSGKKKGQLSCNPLGKNPSDVWDIPNVKHNHIEKTKHPAQFPVELVERLVLSLTNKGDTILDPYMGSGSSAIAALKHGRKSIGIEREKKYVQIMNKRLTLLGQNKLKTRPMNKPIYEPNK